MLYNYNLNGPRQGFARRRGRRALIGVATKELQGKRAGLYVTLIMRLKVRFNFKKCVTTVL
jgi:hypothetical protein